MPIVSLIAVLRQFIYKKYCLVEYNFFKEDNL